MAAPVTVTLAQQLERQRLELASHQRTDRWEARLRRLGTVHNPYLSTKPFFRVERRIPPGTAFGFEDGAVLVAGEYGETVMAQLEPLQRVLNAAQANATSEIQFAWDHPGLAFLAAWCEPAVGV